MEAAASSSEVPLLPALFFYNATEAFRFGSAGSMLLTVIPNGATSLAQVLAQLATAPQNGIAHSQVLQRSFYTGGDDINDAAIPAFTHARQQGGGQDMIVHQVGVECCFKGCYRRFCDRSGRWSTGVVDEDITGRPKPERNSSTATLTVSGSEKSAVMYRCSCPLRRWQTCCHLLQFLCIACHQNDRGTHDRQLFCDGFSDALSAAANQCVLTFQ